MAALPRAARSSGVSPGAGASSMIFWCRRCRVQSRSNRCTACPCRSANTCSSTWRGRSISRSRSTRSSPNAALASRRQAASSVEEVAGIVDPPHPLAAAAGHGLDQQRKADPAGLVAQPRIVLVGPMIARHQRHPRRCEQRLGAVLAAQPLHGLGRRPDEDQPGVAHRPRERGTLRQEPVARMDRLGPGPPRRLQHALGQQIALRRRRRPQPHRLVGQPHVPRVAVGVGVDRHRPDAQPPAGPDDPTGDLAAIGDQQAREHRVRLPKVAVPGGHRPFAVVPTLHRKARRPKQIPSLCYADSVSFVRVDQHRYRGRDRGRGGPHDDRDGADTRR